MTSADADSELAKLCEAYRADRAATGGTDSVGATAPGLCRYCGRRWEPWRASRLDGHARCVVGVGFQRRVREVYLAHPTLTMRRIAEALGVTAGIVNAWIVWGAEPTDEETRGGCAWSGPASGTASRAST